MGLSTYIYLRESGDFPGTEDIMGEESQTEKQSVVPELILRGKVLEKRYTTDADGVLVHVLWGKYEDQGIAHEGFGLQLEGRDGSIRKIPDLSTDAQAVCCLADRMNRYRVSRYHIDDVVEDFLAAV